MEARKLSYPFADSKTPIILLPLNQGELTIIDYEDTEMANKKWSLHINQSGNKYARRREKDATGKYRNVYLHRKILENVLGRPLKKSELVDHINGNSLDNRRCNLRLANDTQNKRNSRKPRNNTSGYKGVTWSKIRQKWIANISINNKDYNLGGYDTPEEAYEAYCKAADMHHGKFARYA